MERTQVRLRRQAIWAVVALACACNAARTPGQQPTSDLGAPPPIGAASDLKAGDPKPADGETGVVIPLLRWTAGVTAVFHNLYLGTDPDLGPEHLVQSRAPMTLYYHPPGFEPGTKYFWRVDEIEADGLTIHTGDVWSFTTLGYEASDPRPADGATFVELDTDLTWTPGPDAFRHEIYFGTNEAAVAAADRSTFRGSQAEPVYDPGLLSLGTTYYWRIDEITPRRYPGAVWRFTTLGEGEGPPYYVDAGHGDDDNDGSRPQRAFATIQKGIEAAIDGSRVLVYPGVYREPIDFLGKAITVRSAGDAAVLDVGDDFAVSFSLGEGPDTVLENFVIAHSFMGVFIVQSSPTIRNLTIANNRYGIEAYAGAEPDIRNCILWGNTGDDLFGCRVRYSCVERGAEGEGNISLDPLFADPDAGDYHLLSWRGRYWPAHDVWVLDKMTSPCLDAGDPLADFSLEPRPNGGRINMGAHGGTTYASLSEAPNTNQPPQVVIATPEDGKRLRLSSDEPLAVRAEAWDTDGAVVKVEFFLNGGKIAEDIDGSDGWTVECGDWPYGDFEIVARATDNQGATTNSAAVSVTISKPMRR
jgi:hypothetical protein